MVLSEWVIKTALNLKLPPSPQVTISNTATCPRGSFVTDLMAYVTNVTDPAFSTNLVDSVHAFWMNCKDSQSGMSTQITVGLDIIGTNLGNQGYYWTSALHSDTGFPLSSFKGVARIGVQPDGSAMSVAAPYIFGSSSAYTWACLGCPQVTYKTWAYAISGLPSPSSILAGMQLLYYKPGGGSGYGISDIKLAYWA